MRRRSRTLLLRLPKKRTVRLQQQSTRPRLKVRMQRLITSCRPWVVWAPFIVTLTGFIGAVIFYLWAPSIPRRMAANGGPMHSFLSHKWYFDEIYNFIFVKGTAALGDLFWKVGDKKIIDGLGPDGVTGVAKAGAGGLSKLHTGYIFHYALVVLLSAVVFAAFALLGQGR